MKDNPSKVWITDESRSHNLFCKLIMLDSVMLQLVEVKTGVLQELDGGSIIGICLEIKLEIELPD